MLGRILRFIVLPLGRAYSAPDDKLAHNVASLLLAPSASRDRLTAGAYRPASENDPIGRLNAALERVLDVEQIERTAARNHGRHAARFASNTSIQRAADSGVINEIEAAKLREYQRLVDAIIQVDEFAPATAHNSKSVRER
jgi:acyl-CoA dehydrogenase